MHGITSRLLLGACLALPAFEYAAAQDQGGLGVSVGGSDGVSVGVGGTDSGEFAICLRSSNLHEHIRTVERPPHLLLFHHPLPDERIHG